MLKQEQNFEGLGNENDIKEDVEGIEGVEDEEQKIVLTEEETNIAELRQKIEQGAREGELLKSITEQKEIVLTPKQEKAKRYAIKCLKGGDTFSAESSVRLLPEQEVQKIAKEIYLSAIEKGNFYVMESIRQHFPIPSEFIKSKKVQEVAKNSYLSLINEGYLFFAKEIQKELFIPEEFIQSQKVQEIIKEKEKLNPELTEKQKKSLEKLRRELKRKTFSECIIERIKELPTEALNSYPDIKENIVRLIVKWCKSKTSGQLVKFGSGLVRPEDYKVPLIQEIGKTIQEESQHSSFGFNDINNWITYFKSRYPFKKEDLLKNADIQNVMYRLLKKMAEYITFESILDIKNEYQLQEKLILKEDFQKILIERTEKFNDSLSSENSKKEFYALSKLLNSDYCKIFLNTKVVYFINQENYDAIIWILSELNNLVGIDSHLTISKKILQDIESDKNYPELKKILSLLRFNSEDIQNIVENMIQNRNWKALVVLMYNSQANNLCKEFISQQKQIAQDANLPHPERQKSFEALAGLAENGEDSITKEFVEIIKKRGKEKGVVKTKSLKKDNQETDQVETLKYGLDNIQEAAYNILLLLDNKDSNEALFGLLDNENVDSSLKVKILETLTDKKRDFLNTVVSKIPREQQFLRDMAKGSLIENKLAIKNWLQSKPVENLDWYDMKFIKAILYDIPSVDLRKKSQKYIGWSFVDLNKTEKGVNQIWQENYPNIPENTFLQIWRFTKGDKELMDKFQNLYSLIKKEGTKKENLLYGIVNSIDSDQKILKLLVDKLKEIDFSSKGDADRLSEVFRNMVFLDKINETINHGQYRYYDDKDMRNNKLNTEIQKIFSKEINNLEELKGLLKEVTTKKIQEVLPNENITTEKIENIEEQWENLEPIFTYLGRYPNLKKYIAEMIANFDSKENWKEWRYNLENKTVDKQIGHLSEEQLEVWKDDYFAEVGDIVIAERESNIPKRIQDILKDAILVHKHIFNPEMEQNKNELIQKTLEEVYNEINKNPEEKNDIIENKINKIKADSKQIDTIINFNDLPKVKESLKTTFVPDVEIQISKKVKNLISFMAPYLSKEEIETLNENCEKIGDKNKIKVNEILPNEIRKILEENISKAEKEFYSLKNSDIFEKLQLDKNNLKNLGQFHQKRRELKSCIDLLRLNNLSNKLIATNRIINKKEKKRGETLDGVLDNLKKYFKDSPLLQDIKNIEFSIKEKSSLDEKRRLAMIFTDNPQMLWQVGKYPLGNGSCQHYAEGGYAENLMGYVGDSNCKVSFLIDLNKLSNDAKKELEEKELEEIKNEIPNQELLNASIARSIIKITKDNNDKPVILLEPTYSIVYKKDNSMDKYFNLFIDLMVVEPMKAKMARSGGEKSVKIGPSRSPGGQYEDSSLNSVKFISKLSKPTKEDEEIIERIRSSR